MTRRRVDEAWRLAVILVSEVLNPLLLISLALFVSVGYILTLLMPVDVDIWASLLVFSVLLPLIPLSLRAGRLWRQDERSSDRVTWRVLLPLWPLPILIIVFHVQHSIPALNTIAHVDIYFDYVIQAFHGSTPLHNVFVPGYPPTHYWLYFALNAAIVKLTSADVYSVFNLVNLAYLFSGLLWLARTIVELNLAKPRTLRLGILFIFVFGALNATGVLSLLSSLLDGSYLPKDPSVFLLDGADRRLYGVFIKIYNSSGWTPGGAAVLAALFVCVRTLCQRLEMSSLVLLSASGIAALGVMPILIPFIVIVLMKGVALSLFAHWLRSPGRVEAAAQYIRLTGARLNPIALLAWLLASLLLSLPLLHYVDEFTHNLQSGISFSFVDPINVSMTLAANFLLLPLAVLHFAQTLRKPTRIDQFLAFSSVIGLLLVLSLKAPDQNQYKLQYLVAMLLALANLRVAKQWMGRGISKWAAAVRVYTAALIVLALLNSAFNFQFFGRQRVRRLIEVRYEGIHIQSKDDFGGRLSAFYWIRDNTPPDAIVVVAHAYTTTSTLFHQRLNYVKLKQYFFGDSIPAYDKRIKDLHVLYDPNTSSNDFAALVQSMESELPGRPFYAVAKYSDIEPAQMAERGAQRVFDNPGDRVAVYLLNPSQVG